MAPKKKTVVKNVVFDEEEKAHNSMVHKKDILVHSLLVAFFCYKCNLMGVSADLDKSALFFSRDAVYLVLSGMMTFLSYYAWLELLVDSRDKKTDRNYYTKELLGHFCYLTHITFSFTCIYNSLDFISDLGMYCGMTEATIFVKVQGLLYSCSVFMSTLQVVVSVLFLKMCWYDDDWQTMVMEIEKREPGTLFTNLWTHMIPAICAAFDLYVMKNTALVIKYNEDFNEFTKNALAFGLVYLLYMDVCYLLNGGYYPYPFLYNIKTIYQKGLFFFGIFLVVCTISALLYAGLLFKMNYIL